MRYPSVTINLEKLEKNTATIVNLCKKHNISVSGVTKVFCGIPEITNAMVKGGISFIADSRIENLKKSMCFNLPKILLRLPMLSQADDAVTYSDISLNSEYVTIAALSDAARRMNQTHKIILMIDVGDLREGILPKDCLNLVEKILKLKGVELFGLGTNLNCFGGVIPSFENLSILTDLKNKIKEKFNFEITMLSGGNSGSLHLLESNKIPKEINNLRLGESILRGMESSYGRYLDDTFDDVFIFNAEIIELKEKPSVPAGEIGPDAFGNKPVFTDRGTIKRAIAACGRQDVNISGLRPLDNLIEILGASSDHMILDVTKSKTDYKVGDVVKFSLDYGALLSAFTSEYVLKYYT
ncbi:MAG: hypothetical protein BWY11_02345 [Firmicutes bacterium ADurb.Bin182]|nr:MAG: hypothetical protein BWY11_02345 [Firmicutes bacterium ADurb.Bin182]